MEKTYGMMGRSRERAMATKKEQHKVQEAAVAYVVAQPPEGAGGYPVYAATRLSTKNQLTLPVAMSRELGLKAGDKVSLWLERGHIVIEKKLHGEELLDSLQGALKGEEWSTKEKADEWLRKEREGWEREWDEESS